MIILIMTGQSTGCTQINLYFCFPTQTGLLTRLEEMGLKLSDLEKLLPLGQCLTKYLLPALALHARTH